MAPLLLHHNPDSGSEVGCENRFGLTQGNRMDLRFFGGLPNLALWRLHNMSLPLQWFDIGGEARSAVEESNPEKVAQFHSLNIDRMSHAALAQAQGDRPHNHALVAVVRLPIHILRRY